MRCPICKADNPSEARRCAKCGAGLAVGERKQVTVLFADFAGYTEVADQQDPEELQDMMNGMWARLDDLIREHGGLIPAHAHEGDNVMALFGAEQAREDDAIRAVRAGLTMQKHLRQTQPRPTELSSRLRVGLHTGYVMLAPVAGQFTATGDTVNLASRMQKHAPEGGVLISHDTYRHVSNLFDMRAMPPLQVKGKPDPLKTYVVLRELPPWVPRPSAPEMVGRKRELKRLQEVLLSVIENRKFQSVTVLGEEGIGKTCLFEEFQQWFLLLPQPVRWFFGRATAEMRQLPFAFLRDVFFRRFEINESDPPSVACEKFEHGFVNLLASGATPSADAGAEWRLQACFIGQLLGLDFAASPDLRSVLPDQARRQALLYLRRFFAAAGRGVSSVDAKSQVQAALLVVEDAHLCDDASLDLIEDLARTCEDAPLMIMCLARPALTERRPNWGVGQPNHTRLNLDPLAAGENRALVKHVLRKAADIPPKLLDFLVERSEGIPFFAVELINMLMDQQVIVPGDEQWRIAANWQEAAQRVPTTLIGVLQARLYALEPEDRAVAQMASVVGRAFWDGAVERLSAAYGAWSPDAIAAALDRLRAKQLILRCQVSAFAGVVEYSFRHELLRDVAYESVLKKVRPGHHAQAAAWLIEKSGARAGEFAATVASHFERADRPAEAAEWSGRAGQHARHSYAPATAIVAFRKALALLPAQPEFRAKRMEWHEGLAEALGAQVHYEEAIAHCAAFLALAEALPDPLAQACAWNLQAYLHERNGHNRDSVKSAEQAELLARTLGVAGQNELVRAWYLKGWACYRIGDAPAVIEMAAQLRSLCTAANDRPGLAASFKLDGVAHLQLGHFLQASQFFEQGLELFHELGNRSGVAAMKSNLGECARLRGDCQTGVGFYREALAMAREIGDRSGEIIYQNNLSGALLGLGQCAEAETELRQVLALAAERAANSLAETYVFLSEACRRQDKLPASLDAARNALALARKSENHLDLGSAWRAVAEVAAKLAASGKPVAKFDPGACFAQSLRVFKQINAEGEQARTLCCWGEWELRHGHAGPKAGREKLLAARDLFEQIGLSTERERVEALLRE